MKKIFILLTALLLILSLFGCSEEIEQSFEQSNEQSSQAAESSEESKNDNTKKLVSKKVIKNGTGEITQTSEYKYNAKGQASEIKNTTTAQTTVIYTTYDKYGHEAESITKDGNGNILSHHQFERDEYGYMLKWRTLDKNGKVKNENIYDIIRDEQDRLIEIYLNGELSQYYTYDEQGNATERSPNSTVYRIYDVNDNTLEYGSDTHKMIYTYENSKVMRIDSELSDTVYKTVYEYDGELLLSQTNYENGEVTLKYLYEYDADGDPIKETMQNALGIASSITEYYYDNYPIEE